MPALTRPRILLHIVELHFAELSWMLERREAAIGSPDWTPDELAELERRAGAHLDGLVIAEEHALDLARPALSGEASEALAGTLVLHAMGVPEIALETLDALAAADAPEPRDGIRLGLRHVNLDGLRARLTELATGDDLDLAAAAADVLAFQRIETADLARLVAAPDPSSRAVAYGALGRLRLVGPEWLEGVLADADPDVQRAGLRAAAMSGAAGLDRACRTAAMQPEGRHLEALGFLGVVGGRGDQALLAAAARNPETSIAALGALGALGDVAAVPQLIELMSDETSALAAAAAFCRITGAEEVPAAVEEEEEPADEEAPEDGPAPSEAEAAAEGEAAQPELDIDAEFAVDLPSPEAAQAWWSENGGRFDAETKWQAGLDVSDPAAVLDRLPMESRRDVYLAARFGDPDGVPDIELEATRRPGAWVRPPVSG